MDKQKKAPIKDSIQGIDGRGFFNRNAAKHTLEQDEILSNAVEAIRQEALSKGKRFSKDKALHILSMDKAFLRKMPAVGGTHRLADSPKKIHARLAKRAQQSTVIFPGIAKALGLGQWNIDVVALRTEIENAMQEHSSARLNNPKDNR